MIKDWVNECSLDYLPTGHAAINSLISVKERLQTKGRTALMAYFKVYSRIFLKTQRKPMKSVTPES
jgi:hypothetical protein